MTYASCPTSIVDAPLEIVWTLLTRPERWGEFYDVRVASVEPQGSAAVGQTIFAESGPRLLHLKLKFRFTRIDAANHELGIDVQLPLGIHVREDLSCVRLGAEQCRVSYHCEFGFPAGWRGAIARLLMRRELVAGPIDSLSRLRQAAERSHAGKLPSERSADSNVLIFRLQR